MLSDTVRFEQISRILVIKLRHHGDVLLTSPVFSVLKNRYPHLELDALVYNDTRDMLELHPSISNLFTVARGSRGVSLIEKARVERDQLKKLRARNYDAIIHLTENNRGLWLSWLLRPKVRAAYPNKRSMRHLWSRTFTHLIAPGNARRHTVEHHLDALRRLGLQPGKVERKLTLVAGDAAEKSVDTQCESLGISKNNFIHLHPTSRWMFKCWSPQKFAALIDRLHERGKTVVVTAAPDRNEMKFVDQIFDSVSERPISLAGQLSLKELAALTARASCFVGVDSAPMHIAAAMQTPVVVLFGPSGELEWGPWQTPSEVITTGHACRPCGQDGCGGGKISECLQDIEVSTVLEAVERLTRR